MNRNFTYYLFTICCLFFMACEKPDEKVIHENKEEFTTEEQIEIGENLSRLMEMHSGIHNELSDIEYREFYEYINTILATIVNTNMVESRNDFDWKAIILKDDERKAAFSIPGGKIYITTGLLKLLSGENELFSLLAHEVYYAESGAVLEAMKTEYGIIPVNDLELGTDSQNAIDIAATIQNLEYTSSIVGQADQFVVEVICPFQYDALGLKSLVEKATAIPGSIQWLDTRPGPENRITSIEQRAVGCGLEDLTFTERYLYKTSLLP